MIKEPRIIFFGTPDFAIPTLEKLIRKNDNIVAVFTRPDKSVGRKQILLSPPIKFKAESLRLKIFQPKTLKEDDVFGDFKKLNPDICVIVAYGKIIPKKYLDVPKYGFINVHPSLLPKYRGPSPIQTAILNGEKETGVTIMVVDEEVDHGKIVSNIKYQISSIKNYKEIENDLAQLGAKLLVETLPKYMNSEIQPMEQDHSQATYTKLLTREDGRIDWNKSPQEIFNQILALNPEPGAWTIWKGKILNIKRAGLTDGKLDIQIIQMEGKKEMTLREFLNGHPYFDTSQLK